MKSTRNRISLNRKKKPIVIPEDKDTTEKTIKTSPLPQKTTKSTRKLRKKKVPYTPSVKPKKEEHCICHLDYQSVDDGRMIQCQNCQTWYHCSCLSLPPIPTTVTGKQIQFRCGRLSCNGGEFDYKIHGEDIFPEGCTKEENIFLKIAQSESKIEIIEQDSLKFPAIIGNKSGTQDSNKFKKTSEELTVFLLNLDKKSTMGLWVLRQKRKSTVNKIHLYIRLLEKKARQNNSQVLNVANPLIKPSESNYSRETHTGTTQSHVTNTPPSGSSS